MLATALRDAGTQQLISSAQHNDNGAFWLIPFRGKILSSKLFQSWCGWASRDDFLGDYNGQALGEDRLFSTALAINALIDIWTVSSNSTRSVFIPYVCVLS